MTVNDWDVVIVGGGLGGLSLAVELAQPEFAHLRVLVLEKRAAYSRDRTWSYWHTHAHRYSGLERKRWHAWRLSFKGITAKHDGESAYCTMDADTFYDFAVAQIAQAPNVQLSMNCGVRDVVAGEKPTVVLADGSVLTAAWVMDGRPNQAPLAGSLCQHFEGWEIETAADCFDDSAVELMNFQPATNGLHFLYVLPYTPRQALVESTWMSAFSHQPDYATELRDYLQSRYGITHFKCVYKEAGCLDLQAQTRQANAPGARSRVVALGKAAGTLRASTGFAFLETIAEAKRIALCFNGVALADVCVPPYRRDWLDAWMDKIFCDGIKADWPRAPEFFMAMFKGVSPNTWVSFLSGRPSLAQRLQVSLQLPKLHFLRAVRRVLVG
jgi:lycopene beta-cyclase